MVIQLAYINELKIRIAEPMHFISSHKVSGSDKLGFIVRKSTICICLLTDLGRCEVEDLGIENVNFASIFHDFVNSGFFLFLLFFQCGCLHELFFLFSSFCSFFSAFSCFGLRLICSLLGRVLSVRFLLDVLLLLEALWIFLDFVEHLLSGLMLGVQALRVAASITCGFQTFLSFNLVCEFGIIAFGAKYVFLYESRGRNDPVRQQLGG